MEKNVASDNYLSVLSYIIGAFTHSNCINGDTLNNAEHLGYMKHPISINIF